MWNLPRRPPRPQRRHHLADLARRLRRVRSDLESCRREQFLPGKSTRIRAGRLAYADLLRDACSILGVTHDLDALRGIEQQLEVLRVEAALTAAGMDLQSVS